MYDPNKLGPNHITFTVPEDDRPHFGKVILAYSNGAAWLVTDTTTEDQVKTRIVSIEQVVSKGKDV